MREWVHVGFRIGGHDNEIEANREAALFVNGEQVACTEASRRPGSREDFAVSLCAGSGEGGGRNAKEAPTPPPPPALEMPWIYSENSQEGSCVSVIKCTGVGALLSSVQRPRQILHHV